MDTTLQNKLKEAGYEGELTLQALIEACSEGQFALSKIPDAFSGWRAIAKDGDVKALGATPIEAVVKLLIELKKK